MKPRNPKVVAPERRAPRPRLPVVMCGLVLLWTVAWYSRGGATGLLVLTAVGAIAAVVLPRSLPSTARSAIWSYVLVGILSLAANIGRIDPSSEAQVGGLDANPYDRAATVVLAAGLTALFFRPSRSAVTIVGVGCLPAMMLALERTKEADGTGAGGVFLWVAFGLLALAAQAQRLTQQRATGIPLASRREWVLRTVLPLLWLLLAVPAVPPVASFAHVVRDWLYDMAGLSLPDPGSSKRSSSLSVSSPPADHPGRVRPLMEIQAAKAPGYLREAVYRSYGLRQWTGRSAIIRTPVLDGDAATEEGWSTYVIGEQAGARAAREMWSMFPLAPRRLLSFCLPGEIRAVGLPDGMDPLASSDGIVSLEAGHPSFGFRAYVDAEVDVAYPWPDPSGMQEYLEVPARLAQAVSNWVERCEGLATATRVEDAIAVVVSDFHDRFSYRLGKPTSRREPLEEFMDDREGHCTLFASAAALMLRVRGVPTRVVAGFLCTERHSFTGRWVVRERDGHAWCEAWDADAGRWRLVEATPSSGLPGLLPSPSRSRLLWELVTHAWRRFVERIRATNPLVAVAEVGAAVFVWAQTTLVSPVGALVLGAVGALIGWRWLRRRRQRSQLDPDVRLRADMVRAMARMERRVASVDLRRHANETWFSWEQRVGPKLPPARAAHLRALLEAYQAVRYGVPLDAPRARAWLGAARREKGTR